MEFLSEIGLFALKGLIVFAVFAGIILVIAGAAMKAQSKLSHLETEKINEEIESYEKTLKFSTLDKSHLKEEKKKSKSEKKLKEKNSSDLNKKKLFVLDFKGDIKASQVENLREEVTAILTQATPEDEVLLRLESPGGMVPHYGLAASQLLRLREKNIPLIISVDKMAASGGYLMACTGNKILCAPFGIVGSIGVVAQVPNLHRLLKKHDVDFKEYTAGEYKRTVSLMGEITPKGEEKFKEQLEQTHDLFKDFVQKNRPQLDASKVGTGEYWYGQQALALGLIDHIQTSDDYILKAVKNQKVIRVKYEKKQPLSEKISGLFGTIAEKVVENTLAKMDPPNFLT